MTMMSCKNKVVVSDALLLDTEGWLQERNAYQTLQKFPDAKI
jgi:hypothetical protein